MPVIVDTCVFSLALRRRTPPPSARELGYELRLIELIGQGAVALLGPVRQELLSGLAEPAQFRRLRAALRAYPHPELASEDYEQAAEVANHCRARGLAGSPVDFLLCGASLHRQWPILTCDRDFERFARVLPLRLVPPATPSATP